jgi:hypothetical protein
MHRDSSGRLAHFFASERPGQAGIGILFHARCIAVAMDPEQGWLDYRTAAAGGMINRMSLASRKGSTSARVLKYLWRDHCAWSPTT